MKTDPYLQNGLFCSRREFQAKKRKKIALTILSSAAIILSTVGAIKAKQVWVAAELFPSYEQVVLGVMNGDVRMEVGNELFECRGGYLGPAR